MVDYVRNQLTSFTIMFAGMHMIFGYRSRRTWWRIVLVFFISQFIIIKLGIFVVLHSLKINVFQEDHPSVSKLRARK
jgi:hypothetical protein